MLHGFGESSSYVHIVIENIRKKGIFVVPSTIANRIMQTVTKSSVTVNFIFILSGIQKDLIRILLQGKPCEYEMWKSFYETRIIIEMKKNPMSQVYIH